MIPENYFIVSQFPAGETLVRLNEAAPDLTDSCTHVLVMRNENLMEIGQKVDILRRHGVEKITLYIPYLPYSRQDRYTSDYDSFALKVFAKYINALNVDLVVTLDAHSDVAGVIDNLFDVPPTTFIDEVIDRLGWQDNCTLLAPDAGAAKKIFQQSKELSHSVKVVCATKHRDPRTGEITHTSVPEIPPGEKVLVVDDICDGGRTFIEVAKKLPNHEKALYVTHGFFTKPDVFGYYNAVFSTDSVVPRHTDSNLNTLFTKQFLF